MGRGKAFESNLILEGGRTEKLRAAFFAFYYASGSDSVDGFLTKRRNFPCSTVPQRKTDGVSIATAFRVVPKSEYLGRFRSNN